MACESQFWTSGSLFWAVGVDSVPLKVKCGHLVIKYAPPTHPPTKKVMGRGDGGKIIHKVIESTQSNEIPSVGR